MRPLLVVVDPPICLPLADVSRRLEPGAVKEFLAQSAVDHFDEGIAGATRDCELQNLKRLKSILAQTLPSTHDSTATFPQDSVTVALTRRPIRGRR